VQEANAAEVSWVWRDHSVALNWNTRGVPWHSALIVTKIWNG